MSPFSVLNNYQVVSRPKKIYALTNPTPREVMLLSTLNSCGTAAGFQVENLWPNKGREKLKKLAAQGVISRHKLDGVNYKLNVYNLTPYIDIDEALKQMVFAQLYLKFKELTNCSAALVPYPLTGILNINKKPYPVVILRKGDSTLLLPDLLKGMPRLIVVSEELVSIDLNIPYRITTDQDILERPLNEAFYDQNLKPEKLLKFAG